MRLGLVLLPVLFMVPASASPGPSDRFVQEQFIRHHVAFAENLTKARMRKQCREAPEMFAWVEFRYLDGLNVAHALTRDPAYLELFRERMDGFLSLLEARHDAYLGWYGSPIPPRIPKDNPDILIDEIQCNFRAIAVMAAWIEQARTNPAYARRHQETIERWLALMTRHLYPKWDERGHFVELPGRGGVYRGLDFPIKGQVTLSFEKLSIMVEGCLRLHRVTGDPAYLKRAIQIGAFFKSNLTLVEDHYEWMSWCPAGPWDVDPAKDDAWKVGWMAPDPRGAWYAAALSIALNLYQHGLLFDETDLGRFIRTQREQCWNGDLEQPSYRNVAGQTSEHIRGRFLSYQIAHYDPLLAKLAFGDAAGDRARLNAVRPWQGGPDARSYIEERYLMSEMVARQPRPHGEIGRHFLKDPDNRAFHEAHALAWTPPGAQTPRTPSDWDPSIPWPDDPDRQSP